MKDIFWIESPDMRTGLAIVMRPRGDHELEDDLSRIKRGGIQTLVSMLEHWEADALGLKQEESVCDRVGLNFISYPIPDRSTPSDREGFNAFLSDLAQRLQSGETIGVHCRGCIGRSTVIAACTLVKLGWNPERALEVIETARGCMVPDTEEQREFILDFQTSLGDA